MTRRDDDEELDFRLPGEVENDEEPATRCRRKSDGDFAEEFTKTLGEDLQQWIAKKNANFEQRMVKLVLAHFGISAEEKILRELCREHTGHSVLNFSWFYTLHPDFPVRLGAVTVPYLWKITRKMLRKSFSNTSFAREFDDFAAAAPEVGPRNFSGLIFDWPEDGLLVLHDAHYLDVFGRREVWSFRKPSRSLYLDLFRDNQRQQGFLYALSEVWCPQSF